MEPARNNNSSSNNGVCDVIQIDDSDDNDVSPTSATAPPPKPPIFKCVFVCPFETNSYREWKVHEEGHLRVRTKKTPEERHMLLFKRLLRMKMNKKKKMEIGDIRRLRSLMRTIHLEYKRKKEEERMRRVAKKIN